MTFRTRRTFRARRTKHHSLPTMSTLEVVDLTNPSKLTHNPLLIAHHNNLHDHAWYTIFETPYGLTLFSLLIILFILLITLTFLFYGDESTNRDYTKSLFGDDADVTVGNSGKSNVMKLCDVDVIDNGVIDENTFLPDVSKLRTKEAKHIYKTMVSNCPNIKRGYELLTRYSSTRNCQSQAVQHDVTTFLKTGLSNKHKMRYSLMALETEQHFKIRATPSMEMMCVVQGCLNVTTCDSAVVRGINGDGINGDGIDLRSTKSNDWKTVQIKAGEWHISPAGTVHSIYTGNGSGAMVFLIHSGKSYVVEKKFYSVTHDVEGVIRREIGGSDMRDDEDDEDGEGGGDEGEDSFDEDSGDESAGLLKKEK
jgi:hypothetical protein